MRESYPLWTAWIGILFYWLYILLTESNEISCYDKKFENNKWTCWGFFSLHYLGHEEYFTKLSRTTMMLITFSWEGCVLGILYYNISPGQGPVMILWAGLIATVTAMPFTYVMGYVFLRKIYSLTLHKYDTLKEMKGVFNKKDSKMDVLEKSIDDTEESLYGYYYWFYVLAFCFFSAFWVIGVHEMMQIHRDNYYLMYHWYFFRLFFLGSHQWVSLLVLSTCFSILFLHLSWETPLSTGSEDSIMTSDLEKDSSKLKNDDYICPLYSPYSSF